MPDGISKVLKFFLLSLLLLAGFAYSGLYCVKGLQLSLSRADLIDVSAYHNIFDLMHKSLPAKIYDYETQKTNFRQIFEEPDEKNIIEGFPYKVLYYYYPPLSLPFAYLWSFGSTLSTFLIINFLSLLLLSSCLWVVFRETKNNFQEKAFIISLILLFTPLVRNILHAQISLMISIAVFFHYFYTLKRQYPYSGIAQSISLIKPQTGVPLVISSLFNNKHRKSLVWCFLSCTVFSLLAFLLIGWQGYKDYFVSLLQLFGLSNFDKFFPMPVPPTPLGNVYGLMCNFLSQDFACKLHYRQIGTFLDYALGFVALIYLILQSKIFSAVRFSEPSKYFLSIITLLLVSPYHHIHDYCLWIAALLIALLDKKLASTALIWFGFVASILFVSDTVFGMNEVYKFSSINILWLLNLVSVIVFSVIFFLKKDDINVSFTWLKPKLKVAKL